MREIKISYNPYRLKTEITVDGAVPKPYSKLNFSDRRLQEWVEDLPSILYDEYSSRDFNITFHGTNPDYDDMLAMAQDAAEEGIRINLTHIPAKEVKDKENAISKIFQAVQEGPFDELRQPDVIRAFNLAKSSDFEVNVIATMSAGKSTLINALLRQKLMPSKQEACTAVITEIKDNDAKNFRASVYNKDGKKINDYDNLTKEIMDSLNSNPEVYKIRAEGNIPFLDSEDTSLVLVDTPGPNNSRNTEHRAATYRMLSESSKTLVLYIMNGTQFGVNDDTDLLRHVAESMSVGGKQSRDRFIFVLNKLDEFRPGEDNIEEHIKNAREYLRNHGIENANIFPASARTALDIRTVLTGCADNDDYKVTEAKFSVMKFNRVREMHLDEFAPLPPSGREEIEEMLKKAEEEKDENTQALIHCGIIPIEMAIKIYIKKYAKTAKIKNIADTFSKRLESAKSFETTKQEIAENKSEHKKILDNIALIKNKLASGEEARKFKKEIENICYDKEIENAVRRVLKSAQGKIIEHTDDEDDKIRPEEAEELCRQFIKFTENLQAEVKVKLEEIIDIYVIGNAEELLDTYRKKIASLTKELSVEKVNINPFELMAGEISTDTESFVRALTKTEVYWVENTNKKWYKPWTWFAEKGHYSSRERVNKTELVQEFFAPIENELVVNCKSAVEYAKEQTVNIKKDFLRKFEELDAVLKDKLSELEDFTADEKNAEQRLKDSQDRLEWLKDIQTGIKAILDI